MYKGLYCSGFLLVIFYVQARVKPYREVFFNSLEQWEMMASLGFLFGGVLFSHETQYTIVSMMVMFVFGFLNMIFFALFAFILLFWYEVRWPILNTFQIIAKKLAFYKISDSELRRIRTRTMSISKETQKTSVHGNLHQIDLDYM